MRIAKVTSFFHPVKGGMENHLYYEGLELLKLGHSLDVLTSDSDRTGKISEKEAVVDGINVIRMPTWFRLSNFTPVFPNIIPKILTEEYDLVHAHSYRQFHNLAILFAKMSGKKAVLSTHWPEYPADVRGKLLSSMTKLVDYTIGPALIIPLVQQF